MAIDMSHTHLGALLSTQDTSALHRAFEVSPMPSVGLGIPDEAKRLYEGYSSCDLIDTELFETYDVKRGLRNQDGSGVLVGLTTICDVHGYNKENGVVSPDEGRLTFRGYDINDLVDHTQQEGRFGYEEVAYLLISGKLPTRTELADFNARINSRRKLPVGYLDIFPRTTASHSIMNVLSRSTLLLYAFDEAPDDTSPVHEVDVACSLLGRLPRIAAIAHRAHEAAINHERLRIPAIHEGFSMAETVLDVLRGDEGFTHDEAMLLDVMLMLHAEHGGGNNSTFTCRVLSSSGTDAYSAYAAAMGSLKGPKHGGANYKVGEMIDDIAAHVTDWENDDELASYLGKILAGEAFDNTGLIYGLGHAVYTVTDPRAELVKRYATTVAENSGQLEKLNLIKAVERLGPEVMQKERGITKSISTNIDMYTGFVYAMLGIPQDMYTPIFAIARMAGWTAHRMEELCGSARIIRPAYKYVLGERDYHIIDERS